VNAKGQGAAVMPVREAISRDTSRVNPDAIVWRDAVTRKDVSRIRTLVGATGYFSADEIAIAAELVEERLNKGLRSGYEFLLAEQAGRLLGYACFGKIDGTQGSFDLYWIAVDPQIRGQGLGRLIFEKVEKAMAAIGAISVYADTSSSDKYDSTRAFYNSVGFDEQARLEDFYAKGDSKIIFEKSIS